MILVRIELHSAITGEATHLGTMVIANDGTGSNELRNYDATLITKDLKRGRSVKILNHPSPRVSIWYLVSKAIKALYKDAPAEIAAAPDAGDWIPGRVS
jgi:hypothetical protein